MRQIKWVLPIVFLGLQGCSIERFFYYPNKTEYNHPQAFKTDYTFVKYPSLNGKTLYALYFRTPKKPLGTIVHFHGNFGNLTNHFPLALFLLNEGFDVLSFDYQGYGISEGRPNRKKSIEDGIATVRYAQENLRDPSTGVAILGQSLGGAVGLVVAAKHPLVRGAVIEAAFTSYRQMTKTVLRRSFLSYPFSWILPYTLGKTYDPNRIVQDISPRPLFFIHGDADKIVPLNMSQELFATAKEPKTLWVIPGAGHLQCSRKAPEEYSKRVSEFFREAIAKGKT